MTPDPSKNAHKFLPHWYGDLSSERTNKNEVYQPNEESSPHVIWNKFLLANVSILRKAGIEIEINGKDG